MSRLAAIALIVTFYISGPAYQDTPNTPVTCSVEGQVVNASTGEALRKATVTLYGQKGESDAATSDAQGQFVLSGLQPGTYWLQAQHAGFLPQGYGQNSRRQVNSPITLQAGQNVRDVVLRLMPAAVISGHVYDVDGDPVQGANVQALRYGIANDWRELSPFGGSGTDDRGAYRIPGLAPGFYYIGVVFATGASSKEVYAPVYYPGTEDPANATSIGLAAGEERDGIDFRLSTVPALTVRGRVMDAATGRPVGGANVLLARRVSAVDPGSLQATTRDASGQFEIKGVPAGSYLLIGVLWGRNQPRFGSVPLEVSKSDIDGAEVDLRPGGDLQGHVTIEGQPQSRGLAWQVMLVAHSWPTGGAQAAAPVGPDGSFTVKGLLPGDYGIIIQGLPADFYLKTAFLNGRDVLKDGLEFSGQAGGALELTVSPAGGRVEGVVLKDNQPAAGATVVLVPPPDLRNMGRLYRSDVTGEQGKFSFAGVPPGTYKVLAWENVQEGAYLDPNFLARYEDRSRPVNVEEGKTASVQLEAVPGGEAAPQ